MSRAVQVLYFPFETDEVFFHFDLKEILEILFFSCSTYYT